MKAKKSSDAKKNARKLSGGLTVNPATQKKAVLIESIIEAFNLSSKSEIVLDLGKLNLQTLDALMKGIHAIQSEKITKYQG
jgi:hypothetical protein